MFFLILTLPGNLQAPYHYAVTMQIRYVEFNRVARVYTHLAAVRRSGQAHNADSVLTHRRPHSIAIRCPACPEIGVNIDKETIEFATEDDTCVTSCYLCNFR